MADWQAQVQQCANPNDQCGECNILFHKFRPDCLDACSQHVGWPVSDYGWIGPGVSPASLLGRYLFCLAMLLPGVKNGDGIAFSVLDVFMKNGGGSPFLYLLGMAQRHEAAASRLLTFEIEPEFLEQVSRLIRK